jgi:hypothetical protein
VDRIVFNVVKQFMSCNRFPFTGRDVDSEFVWEGIRQQRLRAHVTFWDGGTEDGKFEYLLDQEGGERKVIRIDVFF